MALALAVIVAAPAAGFAGDRACKPREHCAEPQRVDVAAPRDAARLRLSSTRNADLPDSYARDDRRTGIWVNPWIVPSFR
jgi:hypothetical protein